MNRSHKHLFFRFLLLTIGIWSMGSAGYAQQADLHPELKTDSFNYAYREPLRSGGFISTQNGREDSADISPDKDYPEPKSVMYKSLMVPGWGQVVNKQIWKIPIIYATLAGLTYYSVYLNLRYHDYRAAYYNIQSGNNDQRFGPTPAFLQNITSEQSLKDSRNYYRNRRDFIYITVGLAYGLNAVDAYVFAHMRSFNVSENLSMKPRLKPSKHFGSPALTLRFSLKSH